MPKDKGLFFITKGTSIIEAMGLMSDKGEKTVFVVDRNEVLFGSLSDGDTRKWILAGGNLISQVEKICNKNPIFVRDGYQIEEIKHLMLDNKIETIPVVNAGNKIIEILKWNTVFSDVIVKQKEQFTIPVVVMAGGKGTRLDPFTKVLPKPLIPIGEKPIIKIILDSFSAHGINEFYISVNHKSKMIKSYFEDESDKYRISYIEEDLPLGTAGSLTLLENINAPYFFVTNCDVIIKENYAGIVNFHVENNYDMTLVASCKRYTIPYGICAIKKGGELKNLEEKPEYDFLVNTGMYIINHELINLIPKNVQFDIPDLIKKAKAAKYKIGVFPISEKNWIDIGQWEEYRAAIKQLIID